MSASCAMRHSDLVTCTSLHQKNSNWNKKPCANAGSFLGTKITFVGGTPLKLLTKHTLYHNDTLPNKVSFRKKISRQWSCKCFRDPLCGLKRIQNMEETLYVIWSTKEIWVSVPTCCISRNICDVDICDHHTRTARSRTVRGWFIRRRVCDVDLLPFHLGVVENSNAGTRLNQQFALAVVKNYILNTVT